MNMRRHSFTPKPPTDADLESARERDPEFVAWLEGLTPQQRKGLSFTLEGEGESLRMTFTAPRINYSGESRLG